MRNVCRWKITSSVDECSIVLLGNSVMWDVLDILCTNLSLWLWLPLFKFYVNVKYHTDLHSCYRCCHYIRSYEKNHKGD